jgi:hypothetical protein
MVFEGHKCSQREGCPLKRKEVMDKELNEIQAEMDQLEFNMQQEEKLHWRYEWPLKRKSKWHVEKVLARRQ